MINYIDCSWWIWAFRGRSLNAIRKQNSSFETSEFAQTILLKIPLRALATSCSLAIPHPCTPLSFFREPAKDDGMKKREEYQAVREEDWRLKWKSKREREREREERKKVDADVQSHSRSCSECKSHASRPALYANARSLQYAREWGLARGAKRARERRLRNARCNNSDSDHRKVSIVTSAGERRDFRIALINW